jgi:hypothetical protein
MAWLPTSDFSAGGTGLEPGQWRNSGAFLVLERVSSATVTALT